MNLSLYNKLMETRPAQHPPEWRAFLEICESYFIRHGIYRPIIVELGSFRGKQKQFWEQLFNAEHIGIDIDERRIPDILGDTHDPKTLSALKTKLGGHPIDVLFIDAGHYYHEVKKDFELYAPLCTGIIALHDAEHLRRDVKEFWEELREQSFEETNIYRDSLFFTIHQFRYAKRRRRVGIGMIIRK